MSPPAWALSLLDAACADAGAAPPRLLWRSRRGEHSTGDKEHLAHFWWVTLGGKPYRDKPYRVAEKHAEAGFTPELLTDWLALFRETLDRHLSADLAEQWYARAANIGRSLTYMHEFRQSRPSGTRAA